MIERRLAATDITHLIGSADERRTSGFAAVARELCLPLRTAGNTQSRASCQAYGITFRR